MVIIWELWKTRNARRHEKKINFYNLILRCQQIIYHFIWTRFPWIEVPKDWEGMVKILQCYRSNYIGIQRNGTFQRNDGLNVIHIRYVEEILDKGHMC